MGVHEYSVLKVNVCVCDPGDGLRTMIELEKHLFAQHVSFEIIQRAGFVQDLYPEEPNLRFSIHLKGPGIHYTRDLMQSLCFGCA